MRTPRKHARGNKRWRVYMWNEGGDASPPQAVEVLAPTAEQAEELASVEVSHFDTYSAEPMEESAS